MSGNGAFGEEMSTDVKVFMDSARVALTEPLDPRLEADLVHLVATEARTASATAPTREIPMGRRRLPARIAVAAGSLVLATAGLAIAGVNLPDPVNSAFEKAGVNLPNQSGTEDSATPVPTGSKPGEGQQDESGKAKGKAHGKQNPLRGKAKGQTGASSGKSDSAPGHTKTQIDPPRATGRGIGQEPNAATPPPASRGRSDQK
jgi:hypothetical protein